MKRLFVYGLVAGAAGLFALACAIDRRTAIELALGSGVAMPAAVPPIGTGTSLN